MSQPWKRITFCAVLMAALLPVAAAPAVARTLNVDDDKAECPGAAYTSIQEAIDDAGEGDTVRICSGLYSELLVIPADKERLQLRARGGIQIWRPASAAVDEASITIAATSVVIAGLAISPGPGPDGDIGVRILPGATATLGSAASVMTGFHVFGFAEGVLADGAGAGAVAPPPRVTLANTSLDNNGTGLAVRNGAHAKVVSVAQPGASRDNSFAVNGTGIEVEDATAEVRQALMFDVPIGIAVRGDAAGTIIRGNRLLDQDHVPLRMDIGILVDAKGVHVRQNRVSGARFVGILELGALPSSQASFFEGNRVTGTEGFSCRSENPNFQWRNNLGEAPSSPPRLCPPI